ncbi:MAG: hypothetical protein SH857_09950 [Chitinophagales bacterium]|nr:hypothetical protein [Chitinophagales bacterium]
MKVLSIIGLIVSLFLLIISVPIMNINCSSSGCYSSSTLPNINPMVIGILILMTSLYFFTLSIIGIYSSNVKNILPVFLMQVWKDLELILKNVLLKKKHK